MRRTILFVVTFFILPAASQGEIIDRIAAIVNDEVITTSEIDQHIIIRLIPRAAGENDDQYGERILSEMIAYRLRYSDVERFGAVEVSPEDLEVRIAEIRDRFSDPQAFDSALAEAEMSPDALEEILLKRIQVEQYIDERFSPLIFISLEEIEEHYLKVWLPARVSDGLPDPGLASVREEIRAILRAERLAGEVGRWTEQLLGRSNVDVYGTR